VLLNIVSVTETSEYPVISSILLPPEKVAFTFPNPLADLSIVPSGNLTPSFILVKSILYLK